MIEISFSLETLRLIKPLILGSVQGLLLNLSSKVLKLLELLSNGSGVASYFLLAAWALQEGKSDTESAPFVLQKLHNTISMEHVSTSKSDTRLTSKLSCVANCAQFVFLWQI